MSVIGRRFGFKVEQDDQADHLTSHAGLPLIIEAGRALGIAGIVKRCFEWSASADYGPLQLIEGFVSAIAAGAKSIADVAFLGHDGGLRRLTKQTAYPSEKTFWRFLVDAHELPEWSGGEKGRAVLPPESRRLIGLGKTNREIVNNTQERLRLKQATIDLDATILESHKRDALAHYDSGRGYQPWVAHWAEADLILVDEFREGNVPAGYEALEQVKRAVAALPAGIEKISLRADTALYDHRAIRWLHEQGVSFGISADMSPELRAACEATAEEDWTQLKTAPRHGTVPQPDVDIADVEFVPAGLCFDKKDKPLRFIAIRKRNHQSRLFDEEKNPRYLAIVTNRWEGSSQDVWWWHREKCGTVERVHDVLKNDLAAGVMPCGRFQSNAAWFRLNVITYNLLSALKQLGLPEELKKARPQTLRYRLLNLAGRLAETGRGVILKLPWIPQIVDLFENCRRKLWERTERTPSVPAGTDETKITTPRETSPARVGTESPGIGDLRDDAGLAPEPDYLRRLGQRASKRALLDSSGPQVLGGSC